jgi:hypothetical protein
MQNVLGNLIEINNSKNLCRPAAAFAGRNGRNNWSKGVTHRQAEGIFGSRTT